MQTHWGSKHMCEWNVQTDINVDLTCIGLCFIWEVFGRCNDFYSFSIPFDDDEWEIEMPASHLQICLVFY